MSGRRIGVAILGGRVASCLFTMPRIHGGTEIFQTDPHWRDHLLFYEYFHGDDGAGLGASHQTGWTGLVARLIQLSYSLTAEEVLHGGRRPLSRPYRRLTGAPIGDVATARESRGAPR